MPAADESIEKEPRCGISNVALHTVKLSYHASAESAEGVNAFSEKRVPDSRQFVE